MARKTSLELVKLKRTNRTTKHVMKGSQKDNAVRFSQRDNIAFRHVTQKELMNTWYRPAEYESFKKDCERTVHKFRDARGDITRLDPVKICLRGLEQQLTRESIVTRRIAISSTIQMVLQEQLYQKTTGQSNPDRVREICRVMSASARRRATTVAAFDAKLCRF